MSASTNNPCVGMPTSSDVVSNSLGQDGVGGVIEFWFGNVTPDNVGKEWTVHNRADARVKLHSAFQALINDPYEFDRWMTTAEGRVALVVTLETFQHEASEFPCDYIGEGTAMEVAMDSMDSIDLSVLSPVQQLCLFLPLARSESRKMKRLWAERFDTIMSQKADSGYADVDFEWLREGVPEETLRELTSPAGAGDGVGDGDGDDDGDSSGGDGGGASSAGAGGTDEIAPEDQLPKIKAKNKGLNKLLTPALRRVHVGTLQVSSSIKSGAVGPLTPVGEASRENSPWSTPCATPTGAGDLSPASSERFSRDN